MAIRYVSANAVSAQSRKSASDTEQTNSQKDAVVKTAIAPSGKAKEALARIEEVAAEKREPKKPLSGERVPFPNRIDKDIVETYKSQGGKTAQHVEAALLEYALTKGWL
jgi:uncharacterized protein (DUF4415 family)